MLRSPLRPPRAGTHTRPLTIQPQPAPFPPSMIFGGSPASSSFVLAAARLRALPVDPGRAAEGRGSGGKGARRIVSPALRRDGVTGPDPYALLTTVALMGADVLWLIPNRQRTRTKFPAATEPTSALAHSPVTAYFGLALPLKDNESYREG